MLKAINSKPVLQKIGRAKDALVGGVSKPFAMTWRLLTSGVFFLLLVAITQTTWFVYLTKNLEVEYKGFIEVGSGLFKEIGFAFIIAWGVSNFIDRKARERDEEATKKERDGIANDVIHAVFGLQHDGNYVRKVVEHTLQPRVVRERFQAEYTLENLTEQEEQDLGVLPGRFIKLRMVSIYSLINVSSQKVVHKIKYGIAVRHGKLRDFARVTSGCIAGVPLSAEELLQSSQTDIEDGYKSYSWERELKPKEKLDVLVEAVTLKELSDNEIWGSFLPTIHGLEFKGRVHVKRVAAFGVRARTASPLAEMRRGVDGGDWKINGPVLPSESLVFWWRSAEDDGVRSEA